ncbi:Helix-turn-helix domain protein [Rosistilla carotiformis]|uniref:Helix-turn-helix domain protein n=1 Tax=Rosistilla carotiformis TaxID=2528017 RepID=A0A518JLT1_9BACT|nr:helix-turn-helix domain-containing protein [Rosistilla carotiformis]QDV66503.1 Helix-turn-helix domain protein [Rosistilla carotiformis]
MANKFIPLEEAAQLLGIPTEKLVEMRSSGDVRAFKDGASWKFPKDEIDRLLADGLEGDSGIYSGFGISDDDEGSAILVAEQGAGSGSRIIGGDLNDDSDLEIGGESDEQGSDVALVARSSSKSSSDSDVEIIANELKLDSDDLVTDAGGEHEGLDSFEESAADKISLSLADDSLGELELATSGHSPVDDDDVDLSIDLSLAGDSPSDGGEIDLSLAEDAASDGGEIDLSLSEPATGDSDLDLTFEQDYDAVAGSGLGDSAIHPPKISLAADSDVDDPMGELGLMEDSDEEIDLTDSPAIRGAKPQSKHDVLSELDLLGVDQGGSGSLISGDSEPSLLGDLNMESALSDISDIDDALNDDDDLVISDDDDDLVLGGAGSDISVVGDSGINLMSPSDSGLSLESEPLDLAGSSISALDLGGDGSGVTPGSGPGSSGRSAGGSGSLVDFKADEEFQLSPSGIGLEADDDSASQVIEIEESDAFGSAMDLGDAGFVDPSTGDGRGWAERNELLADDAQGIDEAGLVADGVEEELIVSNAPLPKSVVAPGYEVPFSIWNVSALAGILLMMSVGGMMTTDLVRNLWTYSETTSPISSLTETILSALGMNG